MVPNYGITFRIFGSSRGGMAGISVGYPTIIGTYTLYPSGNLSLFEAQDL